jgi:hypothetical protein
VNPLFLVVPGWRKSKTNLLQAFRVRHGDEETSIEFQTLERERVDLLARIEAPDKSVSVPPAPTAPRYQYVAVSGRPLALHSHRAAIQVEDHVVTPTFRDR